MAKSHICAGYQREEVIGQKASTFLAGIGTDPQALEALDLAAAKGQDRTTELLHYKRNGSAFCDQVRSLCLCACYFSCPVFGCYRFQAHLGMCFE